MKRGIAGRIAAVTEATTEPVDISGATGPVRDNVTIGLLDTLARLRKLLNDPVLVREGRTMVATPVAVALAEPVQQALADIQSMLSGRRSFDPAVDRRVFTVVASSYVAIVLLHPLLVHLAVAAQQEQIAELRAAGVESVAVCFLFSFLEPAHELRAGELLAEHFPEADVSLSHRVIAQFREFERFTTAAVDAFVKPTVRRYMESLEAGLREAGVRAPIRIMQSNGGVMSPETARRTPVAMMESGPVGGVIASVHPGAAVGFDDGVPLATGGPGGAAGPTPGARRSAAPPKSPGPYLACCFFPQTWLWPGGRVASVVARDGRGDVAPRVGWVGRLS